MRRARALTLAIALAALAGCTAGGGGSNQDVKTQTEDRTPATITFWHGFSAPREKRIFARVLDQFHQSHPWITVKAVGNISDDKIVSSIHAGNPPDVAQSFTTDNVGKFCSSGAWVNLNPYIQQDGTDVNVIPAAAQAYTQFKGDRCALPQLADAYGLYYNTDLLAKAGYSAPPKTVSELTAMARKLTQFNRDGSIKVAGFVPLVNFYEHTTGHMAHAWGAQYFTADGRSNLATDPRWAQMLRWQKSLVDFYGFDKLTRFTAGAADTEFSASNLFENGKIAMMLDGEWRVAFLADEHPELKYATAPFPAADDQPGQYGSGFISGNIIGIPKGAKHPAAAWQLVKFLATDTTALVDLSNELRNVPTTSASLRSPNLKPDPNFKTFLDIFANPRSSAVPVSASGSVYQDLFQTFAEKWQAGKVRDLQGGLVAVDKQIDDQLAQDQGGGAP
jgi:multiple sugar transport system substrate-binding protein